jgi:hypothetical protein
MRFKEIVNRLTGLNLGPFGVSWDPQESEIAKAKRIVAYLEDRRVLYNPSSLEIPQHCVDSVLEIRQFLTTELGDIAEDSPIRACLRAMRAACKKFLDHVQESGPDVVRFGWHHGHWASWDFNTALGELRGVFGVHLAQLAVLYRLDVEDNLGFYFTCDRRSADKDTAWSSLMTQKAALAVRCHFNTRRNVGSGLAITHCRNARRDPVNFRIARQPLDREIRQAYQRQGRTRVAQPDVAPPTNGDQPELLVR